MRAEVQVWLNLSSRSLDDVSESVLTALTDLWFTREQIEKIRVTTFIEDLINADTSDEEEKTKPAAPVWRRAYEYHHRRT